VFKNVPVIVTNFTCELRADVDYIATSQQTRAIETSNGIKSFGGTVGSLPTTWAPSLSTITVQLQPVYSRDTVKQFSMKKFVDGDLFNYNSNKGEGIGFI
jgi:hypothetical protein